MGTGKHNARNQVFTVPSSGHFLLDFPFAKLIINLRSAPPDFFAQLISRGIKKAPKLA